jgi:hypothetical protein
MPRDRRMGEVDAMTSAELLAAKANRCLPEGYMAFTQYALPWQDEEGNYHEHASGTVRMRIRSPRFPEDKVYVVDLMIDESNEQLSDDEFRRRIIDVVMPAFTRMTILADPEQYGDPEYIRQCREQERT